MDPIRPLKPGRREGERLAGCLRLDRKTKDLGHFLGSYENLRVVPGHRLPLPQQIRTCWEMNTETHFSCPGWPPPET